jgi:excinuclease UvrABC nuclease subunit
MSAARRLCPQLRKSDRLRRNLRRTRYQLQSADLLGRQSMKHPVRSDFETAVTNAGLTITFKPTNSIFSFYRLADANNIARLGPVSLAAVQHAGPSADTDDYPSDEVQIMAQHIASEVAASVWSVQEEKEADKSTLRRYSIGGDDDCDRMMVVMQMKARSERSIAMLHF